jgi:carbonic anhydrase/acetyltransferase-like protein (isoleucine patch superfamily)
MPDLPQPTAARGGIIRAFEGHAPRIDRRAFVAETALLLGDVVIGAGSSIWYGCVLRGDGNLLRIGERSNIQDGTVVHVNHQEDGGRGAPGFSTLIGSDVTVGHMAMLHACVLEDFAFVGMNATVMDAAVVESDAMVAAGALVTPGKRVPSGELWAGRPAKKMRDLSPAEIEDNRGSAAYYAGIAARYLKAGL